MNKLKSIVKTKVYHQYCSSKIKNNTILFFSYYGEHYSGSPKYLSEYILEHDPDIEVVWAFTEPEKYKELKGIQIVRYSSLEYYQVLATAKVIVTNYRMTEEFQKRKEQVYIQTWHSSLRLKMIEKDTEETLPQNYVTMAKKDSTQIDYLLAGCKKGKEIFEKAFWYNGDILECGTPQCDILFQQSVKIREKVCNYFNVPTDTRFMIYAPTFRKNHSLEAYNLEYEEIIETIERKMGGKWVLLLRLHPHLINLIGNLEYGTKVLEATKYDEVQELLSVSDILISDYSAIMFDYAVTEKPCFLYVPDLEDYISKDRNLYFDIEQLPFPHAKTNKALMEQIDAFDEIEYKKELKKFLEDEIGTYDHGHACENVCKQIEKVLRT